MARRLRTLEHELNVALFNRRPEGYSLTAAAKQLLPDAELMESAAATLERKTSGMDKVASGKVRIAATESLARCFLAPALAELRESAPAVTVALSTAPTLVDIRRGEADMAIRSARPTDNNAIVRRLATFQLGLYAAESYLSRRGWPSPGNAFAGHDLVMFPREAVPQYWRQLCGEPITNGNVVLETASQWTYIEALRQGVGIGMMAQEIMEKCCPELQNVMPTRREPADIWLVVNPDVWPAEKIQVVVAAIGESFGVLRRNRHINNQPTLLD